MSFLVKCGKEAKKLKRSHKLDAHACNQHAVSIRYSQKCIFLLYSNFVSYFINYSDLSQGCTYEWRPVN